MPHFVIDCSENLVSIKSPEEIMNAVFETAEATGLFAEGDIKVRINAFKYFMLGDTKESFIHVFANIMQGRTVEQKKELSAKIVTRLTSMFADMPIISVNVVDFEKATYCNRNMI